MKTISNLSMEVMNLNQITIKDQRIDYSETNKMLQQVDSAVKKKFERNLFIKLSELHKLKENLLANE